MSDNNNYFIINLNKLVSLNIDSIEIKNGQFNVHSLS